MSNLEKYSQAFVESFEVDSSVAVEALEYNSIPEWDSIGHMGLIAALEDAFDIAMETDDIIEFSSFEKGKELMAKYGVTIN
ncbi:MAG: acyl carrier protein [Kordiimonas sp.]